MTHSGPMDLFLVPWMFIVLPIISTSQSACPERCTCDTERGMTICQQAGQQYIPWNLPAPMELTHLDLSHNDITAVNAQVMYPNLRYLDLSNNKIIFVLGDNLRDLPHLEVLQLKGNHLSSLEDDVFIGMTTLRSLDISNNQLDSLQAGLFRDLASLEELNLARNSLSELDTGIFLGLHALHHLNLAENHLESLTKDSLTPLVSLKTLDLGYNQISNLSGGALSKLPMLREVDLEANLIQVITDDGFVESESSRVSYIEAINLRNNRLTDVPKTAFSKLENVRTIDLSQNPISEVTSGAFYGLGRLRSIRMNTMSELHSVHNNVFVDLSNLQEFEMHSNHKLDLFESSAFRDVPQLKVLDLHANALRTLSVSLVDWESLRLLDLRYNPWHCDCHLSWLPYILQRQATNLTQYITQEVRCHTPKSLTDNLVINVEEHLNSPDCPYDLVTVAMKPEFQDHIMITIMCSVGGILVVIIVILMCKYGKSYSRAYAPAMDQYVCRSTDKMADDEDCQRVPVIEGDKTMSRALRSSLSSNSGIGVPRNERRLHRVRFAEADHP